MGGRPLADCDAVGEIKSGGDAFPTARTPSLLLRQLTENIAQGKGDKADEQEEEKRTEEDTMGFFRRGGGQSGFPFGGATFVFGDFCGGCRGNAFRAEMFETVDDGCPILNPFVWIL